MPRLVNKMVLPAALLLASLGVPRGANAGPQAPPVLAWSFDIHEGRDASPHGRVFLRVNGRSTLILPNAPMQFSPVPRSEYRGRHMPAAALTACSGWWAGAGMNLYAIRHRGWVDVFRQDLDEQAPDSRYRLIKSVSLTRG